MPTARVADALRSLARDPDPPADGDLVVRFAQTRDPDAFAELIRRHGPTVYGVCRRVLGHAHDAEDAFQAVWIVLARRAADVKPPGSVGNFLYGVAVRTATKARTLAAKRRQRLMAAAKPEPVADPPAESDLKAVLDEELAHLPDKLRAAVVLCDLNGKSRSAAAAELGWPEGTVAARQQRGRALLADRLRRRGVTLSAAALAAALAPEAVSAELGHDALVGALGMAVVPPTARLLAEGVMRSMSATRWKLPAALLMTAGLLAGGVVWAARPDPDDPPRRRTEEKLVIPVDAHAKPAAGGNWKEAAALELVGWLAGSVAYSPDGKVLLVGGTDGHVRALDAATRKPLWDYRDESGHFAAVAYSRDVTGKGDGSEIAVTFKDGVKFLDPATGKLKDTLTEPGSAPIAVGYFRDKLPGANIDATVRQVVFGDARGYHVKTWLKWPNVGGINVTVVQPGKEPADKFAAPLAVDPRGRAETHAVMTGPLDRATGRNVLWAYACGNGSGNHLMVGHKAAVTAAAWSADGSTIVTGDADGVVIVWDAATFKAKAQVGFDRRVAALAVTADGARVAAAVVALDQSIRARDPGYREQVHVWEPGKPKPATPVGNAGPYGSPFAGLAGLAFSPDGKELAAAYANFDHLTKLGEPQGTVRVWRLKEEDKPAPAEATTKPAVGGWGEAAKLDSPGWLPGSVTYSPDGKAFAIGGTGGNVRVFDTATRKELWVVKLDATYSAVAFTRDGKSLAATFKDGVKFLDAATGKAGEAIIEKDSNPTVVATLPDEPVEGDPQSRRHKIAFDGPRGTHLKNWVQWSQIDGYIAGAHKGVVEQRRPLGEVALAADPRGDYALVTGQIRDQSERFELHAVHVIRKPDETGFDRRPGLGVGLRTAATAYCAAWSDDRSTVVMGIEDGVVVAYDVATLTEIARAEFGGRVTAVAVTADGSRVAAAVVVADPVEGAAEPNYHELVYVWEPGKPRPEHPLGKAGQFGGPFRGLAGLAFAPDGQELAAGFANFDHLARSGRLTGAVRVWRHAAK